MHKFPWFGQQTPLFFMLHDERRLIRGYIPNRNCKGMYIKGKGNWLLSTYIHIIHTCPQSMNILIPNA